MIELPDLSTLSHEQKDALILFLFQLVQKQDQQIKLLTARATELEAKVAELEARLSMNSKNSSKPPSSDGLRKTQSLRTPSGKSPGGQKGHPGNTLKKALNADKIINHPLPKKCQGCGNELNEGSAELHEARQVFDIPIKRYEVTEHRTFQVRCTCGQIHQSNFPQAITETVQYGPNIKALGVDLVQGEFVPFQRSSQLLCRMYGLALSPATILNWVQEASVLIKPHVETIKEHLVAAPLVHADESGFRVASALNWLHIVATKSLTWYGVHAKRGIEAIKDHGILTERMGALVHDCWKPYWRLNGQHILCNSHLVRELNFVFESTQEDWAKRLSQLLLRANKQCDKARQVGQTKLHSWQVSRINNSYWALLAEAGKLNPVLDRRERKRGRIKQSFAFNLLRRLRQYADEILHFTRDLEIPFTNNVAERAVRMPKVKIKISGCFRTFKGAQDFCTIRSYLDTMKKQGHNILEVLRDTFNGYAPSPASG